MKRWVFGALAVLLLAGPARAQLSPTTGVRSFGAGGVVYAISPQPSGQPLKLFSVVVSSPAAGYLMVFESVSVPPTGYVSYPLLRFCAPISASVPYGFNWGQFPDLYNTSAVVAFSSTGCNYFSPQNSTWIGGQAQ